MNSTLYRARVLAKDSRAATAHAVAAGLLACDAYRLAQRLNAEASDGFTEYFVKE